MNQQPHRDDLNQDTSDGILVQRSGAGDHEAFECLVERYRPLLVRSISRWCSDSHLASDIAQCVWIQLSLCLPTVYLDRPLKAWLVQVAHNYCMDEHRRKQLMLFSQFDLASGEEGLSWLATLPDPDPPPEELVEQREMQHHIMQAIQALPDKQRVIVWLRYADQLSFVDIGRRLNMPVATAKTTFARAKPLLRHLLTEEASRASNELPTAWKRLRTRRRNGEQEDPASFT